MHFMRACDGRPTKVHSMTAKRVVALLLFLAAASPALAQLQTAPPPGPQTAPAAAPAAPGASTETLAAPIAAPSGNVASNGLAVIGGDASGNGGFNLVSMFLTSGLVVQAVMVLLLLASLWSWAIIFNKALALSSLKRKAAKFEKLFWSGQSLDDLYQQVAPKTDHPMAAIFIAALREWRRAFETGNPRESQVVGVKERIDKAMNVTILRETDGIERQLGFLATVGSVSPFIGLFGTVWGIMNAFNAIAARHDTTLAVVAPGIAEALFTTAMGLLAAVPAVIFYNRFVNEIGRYVNRLDAFAEEFSAILSRQLEEKATK
jgi:biopolymer transport protein TolQ